MKPGHRNAGRWIWLAVVLVKPINAVFFKRRWRGREHVPSTGAPAAIEHASHAPALHGPSQHTASAQKLDWHWVGPPHAAPLGSFALHVPPLQ